MFDINSITKESTNGGRWADFCGGRFLIAHTSSIAFQREFHRLQQPYRKQISRGTLDPKISTELMCRSMAKALLLDWQNVGSNGSEIPYSEEMAYKVLLNNEELREFVQEFALNLDNFREEDLEESGKS